MAPNTTSISPAQMIKNSTPLLTLMKQVKVLFHFLASSQILKLVEVTKLSQSISLRKDNLFKQDLIGM
jgi:hypothetical protein